MIYSDCFGNSPLYFSYYYMGDNGEIKKHYNIIAYNSFSFVILR